MTEPLQGRKKACADIAFYQTLSAEELKARIQQIRSDMGSRLLILGHHYQQDDVIAFCDLRGDSYQLASMAASHEECRVIVFCGVHFMAETADILANRPERLARRNGRRIPVVLPDLTAGCSLADLANIDQVEESWKQLAQVIDVDDLMPITYVNSAASLKAFCGKHGGLVCTSSNARAALEWAFARKTRVLFFPDQHLARNTARNMGISLEAMPLWDFQNPVLGGNSAETIQKSRVILWNGLCSVHQEFQPGQIDLFREKHPGIQIIVHPECCREVVEKADLAGSTSKIIEAVQAAPPGSKWAIGTEWNLVNRLKQIHPEQEIYSLSPLGSVCPTMCRIDLPHLCWSLENFVEGTPVNVIEVDAETSRGALLALQRMLEIK